MSNFSYYIFNKPYNVLSQFTKELPSHQTLADYLTLSPDVYPVGRLDKDSEGMLLLTNDNNLKNRLLDPKNKSSKTYLVQVDGQITAAAIHQLESGVSIKLKKGYYQTKPCNASIIDPPPLEERNPPVRYRASIPTSWIKMTITEGKNRQIRKMCASVGFPCLRLFRIQIGQLTMQGIPSGTYRKLTEAEVALLKS